MSTPYCPPAAHVESSGLIETLQARSAQVASAGGVEAEGLLECLARIPDPRDRRGIRYTLAEIVVLCLAAVLSGEKSRVDIVTWVAATPRWLLAAAGIRPRRGRLRAPHADTVERVLNRVDGQVADDVIGRWFTVRAGLGGAGPEAGSDTGAGAVAEMVSGDSDDHAELPDVLPVLPVLPVDGQLAAIAVDGKAMAGAVGPDGRAMFLFAAATHTATSVLAQQQIGPKSNEIPSFAPLLRGLELAGAVVTMDSLHTQRAHARFLIEGKRAHFVMIVKENQLRLFAALNDLAWTNVPVTCRTDEHGHGRHEVRTIQVMPAPGSVDALFPHVAQVFLVERYVTRKMRCRRRGSGRYYTKIVKTAVAVLGITSLTAEQADPAQLAALVRGHWAVEAMHWVRDVTFREDKSAVKTGDRPRLMATFRNTSIGLIRQSGTRKIAATIRELKHDPDRLLAMLGLESHPKWAPDLH